MAIWAATRPQPTETSTPPVPTVCGWNRVLTGRDTLRKPSRVSTTRAAISSTRKVPVTQALVRMLSTATTAENTITPTPTHLELPPDQAADRYSPVPRAITPMMRTRLRAFIRNSAKPVPLPSTRAAKEYSPPAIGNAEDSSA